MELDRDLEVTIWSQGIFHPGHFPIETLVSKATTVDYAALLFTPDDIVERRGETRASPRGNVLVEAGMFIGLLGRDRAFIVRPDDVELDVPTDFEGITPATYRTRTDGNFQAALSPAAETIRQTVSLQQTDVRDPLRSACGTWRGTLWSSWGSEEKSARGKSAKPLGQGSAPVTTSPLDDDELVPHVVFVTIEPTGSGRMRIRQMLSDADAVVLAYDVVPERDGDWSLQAIYDTRLHFDPAVGYQKYWGAMVLVAHEWPTKGPAGDYWTQEGTVGTLQLEAWSSAVYPSFERANDGDYEV